MPWLFKVDVTNTAGTLSKEHFPEIKAGTVLSYEDNLPERILELEKIGLVEEFDEVQEAAIPLPDDYIKLKEIADGLGIEYPGNISKKDLIEKIQDKQTETE